MKTIHNLDAQCFGWNFTESFAFQLGDDFIGGLLQFIRPDRPFLAGFGQTAKEFLTVQRLPAPVAFDDDDISGFYGLVCGEAVATRKAFPSPADGRSFPGDTGINHLVLIFVAFWAAHT